MRTLRIDRMQEFLHESLPALAMAALLCVFALVITVATLNDGDATLLALSPVNGSDNGVDDPPPNALRLPGGKFVQASASALVDLGPTDTDQARWVVWIARDPVDQVWVESGGWRSPHLDFFRPAPGAGLIPGPFMFPLPSNLQGSTRIDVHVAGSMAGTFRAQLLREDEAAKRMQRAVALNAIVYTGLFTLAMVALALFWAARERFFMTLFACTFLAGLLLAACNGHLYALPGLRMFGLWRGQGIWALSLLFMAAVLVQLLQFANHRTGYRMLPRIVQRTSIGFVAAAALCLLHVSFLTPVFQPLTLLGAVVTGVLGSLILLHAVRLRVAMALPTLVLLLAMVAGLVRAGVAQGLVPDMAWTRYGYQLAVLALLGVQALGLIDRIGEYRNQRDRDRIARDESERRMARESARTDLTRAMQARLRDLSPADIEWIAFRLLLEYLLPQVPADTAIVIAHGYHGRDALVSEPMEHKRMVEESVTPRLLALKRQAFAHQPLQQSLFVEGERVNEIIIPIAIDAPGWGVLLLRRREGEFSTEEMALAHEFVRLTTLHADEAVSTQTLRRTAELDSLTGTLNRRSIDHWLARNFGGPASGSGRQVVSLLFVDIDHFKQVNDLYGHACGDHCLRGVAESQRLALRPQDLLGRYGGEEFIAILPGCDATSARVIAERVRATVEDRGIEWQGQVHRLTVSVGVATRHANEQSPSAAIERADRALYAAKRAGRNRIQVAPAFFGG